MKLDRDYMLKVIEQGGSIIINQRHYDKTNLAEFPSVADLAKGDVDAEKAAADILEEQLQAILAEKAKLEAAQKESAQVEVKDSKKAK